MVQEEGKVDRTRWVVEGHLVLLRRRSQQYFLEVDVGVNGEARVTPGLGSWPCDLGERSVSRH